MIDTSDEAIEADLERAARGGTPGQVSVWVAWAQVRATLAARMDGPPPKKIGRPAFSPLPTADGPPDIQIAVGPFGDSYAVPAEASWEDRITAAERLLGFSAGVLAEVLPKDGSGFTVELGEVYLTERQWRAVQVYAEHRGDTSEPVVIEAPADLELDIDEDDIDEDFFRNEREARDR